MIALGEISARNRQTWDFILYSLFHMRMKMKCKVVPQQRKLLNIIKINESPLQSIIFCCLGK